MSKPVTPTASGMNSPVPQTIGLGSETPVDQVRYTVKIRVIGAMGPPHERDLSLGTYYVKMSVCEKTDKGVVATRICHKTSHATATKPMFERAGHRKDFPFRIDIDKQLISVELKEDRTLTSNRVVGTAILNERFLGQLRTQESVECWLPLRNGTVDTPVTALLRVICAIPELHGGREAQPEAVKVIGASMRRRKVQVTVYNASIPKPHSQFVLGQEVVADERGAAAEPTTQVSIHTGGLTSHDTDSRHVTKAVKGFFPEWNETFDLYAEMARCKALILKLRKVENSLLSKTAKTMAILTIPMSFYLSSTTETGDPTEVWDTYTMADPDTNEPIGVRIEVRINIASRAEQEMGNHFFRVESTQPEKPSLSRAHSGEDITAIVVCSDDEEEDENKRKHNNNSEGQQPHHQSGAVQNTNSGNNNNHNDSSKEATPGKGTPTKKVVIWNEEVK